MANKYTAPNDYRAFCEMLGETENSMSHHGVKGMHWGERKYQNLDGSLTEAGRKHYGYGEARKKTSETEPEGDTSDKKIAQITAQYEFNKEYTLRDPLVKKAISVAKQWDAERNNSLYINEQQNKSDAIKNVAITTLGSAGISGAFNAARYGNYAGEYVRAVQKSVDDFNAKYSGKTYNNDGLEIGGVHATVDWGPKGKAGIITSAIKEGGVKGILIGGAAGLVTSGAIFGVKAIKAKQADTALARTLDEISKNQNVDKNTGLKLKSTQTSPDDDMAKVNPGYKNWSDGTKSNCAICTATYALRRKGYDVTANGSDDGYDTTAFLQAFPKASMRKVKLSNDKDALKAAIDIPEGGYGNLSVNWKRGGGHSMVVSVEGGQVVIRDTQSNKTYRGAMVNKILSQTTGEGKVIRLDNANPDIAQMKKMGMINPIGQNFQSAQKVIADINYGESRLNKKHGDAGIIDEVVLPTIARTAVTYATNKGIEYAKTHGVEKLKGMRNAKKKNTSTKDKGALSGGSRVDKLTKAATSAAALAGSAYIINKTAKAFSKK